MTDYRSEVSVVGLGKMGSALAAAFLSAGRDVTVWNRTPARSAQLREIGARSAPSIRAAVRDAPITVACMSQYADLLEHLSTPEVETEIEGHGLVNVMVGSAEEARKMERWVLDRGADYLDGAIPAYPAEIGNNQTMISYSGSRALWDLHGPLLMDLGGSSYYAGEDVAAPNIFENAFPVWFYHAAHIAFLESTAASVANGLDLSTIRRQLPGMIELLSHGMYRSLAELEDATSQIDGSEARYVNDQADIGTLAEAFPYALADAEQMEHRAATLRTAAELVDRAVRSGFGDEYLTALYRCFDGAGRC